MSVDFGQTATEYARTRGRFPPEFFGRLIDHGWAAPGATVLDIGTGTGAIARGLAERGCEVVGLDPSLPLMAQGRSRDAEVGVRIRYVAARGEAICFPAGRFDTVISGQSWHWLQSTTAMAEARRVLTPGGKLLITQFDWLSLPGNVVEATERLIRADNPDWTLGGHGGFYPEYLAHAATAGFEAIETFSVDVALPYTHDAWRARLRATGRAMRGRSPSEQEAFDDALAALLEARFRQEPVLVPHRIWTMKAVKPA